MRKGFICLSFIAAFFLSMGAANNTADQGLGCGMPASQTAGSSTSSSSGGTGAIGPSSAVASGGFLWKPVSESNGKLVVLLPTSLKGLVKSAGIYTAFPYQSGQRLASGTFSGDTKNGNRPHYRFGKPGSGYPNGVYLIAFLSSGKQYGYRIASTSRRNENVAPSISN
jgi:hypothetical protein